METALAIALTRQSNDVHAIEIKDFGDQPGRARRLDELDAPVCAPVSRILDADASVVATPIDKRSYPGAFQAPDRPAGPASLGS